MDDVAIGIIDRRADLVSCKIRPSHCEPAVGQSSDVRKGLSISTGGDAHRRNDGGQGLSSPECLDRKKDISWYVIDRTSIKHGDDGAVCQGCQVGIVGKRARGEQRLDRANDAGGINASRINVLASNTVVESVGDQQSAVRKRGDRGDVSVSARHFDVYFRPFNQRCVRPNQKYVALTTNITTIGHSQTISRPRYGQSHSDRFIPIGRGSWEE